MEGARAPAPPKDGTKSLPKPVEPARVRSSGGWSGTPARKVEGGSVEVGSAEGGSSEGGSAEGGSGGGANVSMAAPIPMAFSAAAGRTRVSATKKVLGFLVNSETRHTEGANSIAIFGSN